VAVRDRRQRDRQAPPGRGPHAPGLRPDRDRSGRCRSRRPGGQPGLRRRRAAGPGGGPGRADGRRPGRAAAHRLGRPVLRGDRGGAGHPGRDRAFPPAPGSKKGTRGTRWPRSNLVEPGARPMNDLDLVRTLRADVPSPAPARLAAGRSRILAAAATRRRRYWRLALPPRAGTPPPPLAPAAAPGGPAPPAPPRPAGTPSRPAPAATARVSLAARILTVAARTVAAGPATRPATRPGDRQWIYSRFVQTQTGTPAQDDENWIRFDGREQAYYLNGQLIVLPESSGSGGPLSSYRELAALPAAPSAILAAALQVVGTTQRQWENWSSGSAVAELAPRTAGEAEFDYLAQLLWNAYAAAPPAALAHVYQAMADIPGVTVTPGLTSAVGRPGIGVSANGGVSWLLLDPQTYQVIGLGEKALSQASVKVKGAPITFSGTISISWADVAVVAAAGQR